MEMLVEEKIACVHCGTPCPDTRIKIEARGETEEKHFCCEGCKSVYLILAENDLCTYYALSERPGIPLKEPALGNRFDFLDQEAIVQQLLDFSSPQRCRLTLSIPSIHCSSCIWLLENLYRLREGVLDSRVHFLKKELALSYDPQKVRLREIVETLATLGYEPHLSLEEYSTHTHRQANRDILLKVGITGFCTGNIMLLSLAEYFGWQIADDAVFRHVFTGLNVLLSLPVFFYGASGYLQAAYQSLREQIISIEVPLALGITTLFGRSLYETLTQTGPGYWDSLASLVFFLLVGKWVQGKTFENLSFERSFKSYFPLAATLVRGKDPESVPVTTLQKGDRIRVLHQGLVAADSMLLSPQAWIDYSFVTGEAEPVEKKAGDRIYAGGRQIGPQIELMVLKPVSQSYLTQLWNNEAFSKAKVTPVTRLASRFSRWFTWFTLALACFTGLYWHFTDQRVMWNAFTAVLMVACPCALSLSMPFTMGMVMSLFGRNRFYVKNPDVIGHLANINHVVFDKTGTLTQTRQAAVAFSGEALRAPEQQLLLAATVQSSHPLSRKVSQWLRAQLGADAQNLALTSFRETPGQGIEAQIQGHAIRIGSAGFTGAASGGGDQPGADEADESTSKVFVNLDGAVRGCFTVQTNYRQGLNTLISRLKTFARTSLLSGDRPVDQDRLKALFDQQMLFRQSPTQKLAYVRQLQAGGQTVLMVGDGLNDAGALKQSDVGLVLTDDVNTFFPACDALLDASRLHKLPDLIRFSRTSIGIVKVSFLVSLVYNFIGLSWAVSGQLSPVFAAILMPVSSLSVVFFALGITRVYAKRLKD
jgi:Cu+-exporting ATPase